jgi:hypothetical protein
LDIGTSFFNTSEIFIMVSWRIGAS